MPKPRIRPTLERAANELSELARNVAAEDIEDDRLTAIGRRRDTLLQELVSVRALNLADLLVKLTTWALLPVGLWNRDSLIDACIWDLRRLISGGDDDIGCAPVGWKR